MTTMRVGMKIPDVATMDALPIGAAVTRARSGKLLTKEAGGWAWHSNPARPANEHWWDGMELVSLPGSNYTGPMPGERVSPEHIPLLPVGTVLAREDRPEWQLEREGTGNWTDYSGGGGNRTAEQAQAVVRTNQYVVESLPEDLGETVEQFAQRFRDLAVVGAERANGTHQNATRICSDIGIEFTPSVGMRVCNVYDRGELPEGSRVYVGHPDEPDTFSLWEKQNNGAWRRVFGEGAPTPTDSVAVVIDALPQSTEPEPWLVAVPGEDEPSKIAELRAKAWKIGYAEKQNRGWCEEFERIMLRGGISAESANIPLPGGKRVGDTVTIAECAALPVGTILTATAGNEFALYRRTAESRNQAGTERIMRTAAGFNRHYSNRMVIICRADDTLHGVMPVGDAEVLAAMPDGTEIGSPNNGRIRYRKLPGRLPWHEVLLRNGAWSTDQAALLNANYSHDTFARGGWFYYKFGGTE